MLQNYFLYIFKKGFKMQYLKREIKKKKKKKRISKFE